MDLRPPARASYAEGAALLTTYLTAWIPLTRQVRIHPTSNLLITAAAGGVGTAAIQVGLFAGATVTAAAGSPEKLALARELGAQRTVTYEEIADLDDIDIALDGRRPRLQRLPEAPAAARRRDRDRLRGRRLGPVDPARRPEHRRAGLLPGPPAGLPAGARPRRGGRAARALAARRDQAGDRRGAPARARGRGPRPDRLAPVDREGRPVP